MASNNTRWVGNINGATEPYSYLALFQTGATQAIKRGEILEFSATTNTQFVPIDSDFDMSDGAIAIAAEEVKSGDRAGYYRVHLPRPGDLWEFDLASASAITFGTPLYYSSSEAVTTTAGVNLLGHAAGQANYPLKQGHLADDASLDTTTTVKSTSTVIMTFSESNSYYSRIQKKNGTVLRFAQVADSAEVENTTTETAFSTSSAVIDGTQLQVGDVLEIIGRVFVLDQNSTDTLDVSVYVGTEKVANTGAVDVADSDVGYVHAFVTVRTLGATGTLSASGVTALGVPGTVTAKPFRKDQATEDISGSITINMRGEWSVAHADNEAYSEDFVVLHHRRG